MGGRDHSCEGCGRGGLNDPDGVCVCPRPQREDAIRVLKRFCGIEPEAATLILDALQNAGLFVVASDELCFCRDMDPDETADKERQ